jgi:hypothetical protein
MVLSGGTRHRARLEVHARAPREHADHRLEQRRVDDLPSPAPLALEQREADALRREDAGEQIRDRDPGARRADLRCSGQAHESAHPLRDLIESGPVAIRAVGTEARDPAVHEPREALAQVLGREPELRHHVGAEVLDEHVEARQQAQQQLAASGLPQVQRERALAAIG